MKKIIARALPLTCQYTLIDKKYIPLEDGIGFGCDNCGKIIANMATVKNTSGDTYVIGFDCLETLLINNSLLSTGDIAEYEAVKKMIPKIIRFSKTIKEQLNNHHITGLHFEKQSYQSDYFPFYWLTHNQLTSRNNDYVKLTHMDIDFLLATLRNIFPKLLFIYN